MTIRQRRWFSSGILARKDAPARATLLKRKARLVESLEQRLAPIGLLGIALPEGAGSELVGQPAAGSAGSVSAKTIQSNTTEISILQGRGQTSQPSPAFAASERAANRSAASSTGRLLQGDLQARAAAFAQSVEDLVFDLPGLAPRAQLRGASGNGGLSQSSSNVGSTTQYAAAFLNSQAAPTGSGNAAASGSSGVMPTNGGKASSGANLPSFGNLTKPARQVVIDMQSSPGGSLSLGTFGSKPTGGSPVLPGSGTGGPGTGNGDFTGFGGSGGSSSPGGFAKDIVKSGLETEVYAPFQRTAPTAGDVYSGTFLVRLAAGVDSATLAQSFGAKHEFAYPHMDNTNIWKMNGSNVVWQERRLLRDTRVVDAYPIYQAAISSMSFPLPNDPQITAQWHLLNHGQTGGAAEIDANVETAWNRGLTGKGVTVSVVDSGLQTTPDGLTALHPDLNDNYDPGITYDFFSADDNPTPAGGGAVGDNHGTSVAGVIAAVADNGLGVAGVAPDATFGASRLITGGSLTNQQIADTLRWDTLRNGGTEFDGRQIDIYNNSWGFTAAGILKGVAPVISNAVNTSTLLGRGELGSVYAFAAGNSRGQQENTNYSALTNNRNVITVGAVGDGGTFASYSTPGANTLVSAPSNGGFSGITTTDLIEADGNSASIDGHNDYNTNTDFGGTSSATPLVSGVIALMLEANPNLSFRDVQHILAKSAQRIDAGNVSWDANPLSGGMNPNGGGLFVSDDYGFGMVNAGAAVQLASNWKTVGPELLVSANANPNVAIPDNNANGVASNITVGSSIKVEHVEVIFSATHAARGQLQVRLTSPSGTESILARTRTNDNNANYNNWVFSTTRHWDEPSGGDWTLAVSDRTAGTTGTFVSWGLRVYGTQVDSTADGPRVTGVNLGGGLHNAGSVSALQVQFDKPVKAATFTTSDVSLRRVGGSPIPVTVTSANGTPLDRVFNLTFASQSTLGNYRLDVGPMIEDADSLRMNQDGDAINGEGGHDKFTEFFSIVPAYLVGSDAAALIPDAGGGPLDVTFAAPQLNITDLNVMLGILHDFASSDMRVQLSSPDTFPVFSTLIETDNDFSTDNRAGFINGYLNTVLDDEAVNLPLANSANDGNRHFTDSFLPQDPLAGYEHLVPAGNWRVRINDQVAADQGTFLFANLLIDQAGTFDISLDGVSNLDASRDLVEVTYTIRGTDAPAFDLVMHDSRDSMLNINSDRQTGVFTVTNAADLTVGTHTLQLPAGLFPDPNVSTSTFGLYSLVSIDPLHKVADSRRDNNRAVFTGVTSTPDGTLYIAGDPFAANNLLLDPAAQTVTLNGTTVSVNLATTTNIYFTTGVKNDVVDFSGVNINIGGNLRGGDDNYLGGEFVDSVQGEAGRDTLQGNGGNDRLFGMLGLDIVSGNAGNDILSVDEGLDQTLDPGQGSDYILINGTSFDDNMVVWDPDGNNAVAGNILEAIVTNPVQASGFSAVTVQSLTVVGVEAADRLAMGGARGNDLLQLTNGQVANSRISLNAILGGGAGQDTITGGGGSDTLYGDQFSTTTPGAGDGNDTLISIDGIGGNDTVFGAGGSDSIQTDGGDTVFND